MGDRGLMITRVGRGFCVKLLVLGSVVQNHIRCLYPELEDTSPVKAGYQGFKGYVTVAPDS